MELRRILFGYRKEQFKFYVVPEEATIIRRIYKEYLSGDSLLTIANRLTSDAVVYFKDKTQWSKNAVCRILENRHYTGDEEYPKIIDDEIFEKAMNLRMSRGGTRQKDTKEIEYLKEHTVCERCGSKFTRRSNYKTRERWLCTNGCSSTKDYLDDTLLFSRIQSVLEAVTRQPDRLMYKSEIEPFVPTREIIATEKRIKQLMFESKAMFQPIRKLIVDIIDKKFSVMEFDPTKEKTGVLCSFFENYKSENKGLDLILLKKTVSCIFIDRDGNVRVKFINGAEVTNKQVNDNE